MNPGNERNKPRILLLSSAVGWIGVARFPKALKEAGAEVYGLYHARSWLRHTRWFDDRRTLPDTITRVGMRRRIYQAVADWQPTLILPGDDEVVPFLYELWRSLAKRKRFLLSRVQRQTLELLHHSLGGFNNLKARYLRHSLIELARQVDARVPEAIETKNWREALAFADSTGFPVVVKQDHSAGGGGVRVCHSAEDLEKAFKDFQQPPVRWGIWRRIDPFLPTFLKTFSAPYAPELEIQQFVSGETWMSTAVSYKGQCLSDISLGKEKVFPPITGPSCVIRLDSHAELEESTRKILQATEFTGCASLDYVICEKTKQAYLIEMNPRPTPPLSISPLMGRDLPQALLSIAQGDPKVFEPRAPEHPKIAAYPGEVLRDPNSEYIQQYHHDVPTDDPDLERALQEYIEQKRAQQTA